MFAINFSLIIRIYWENIEKFMLEEKLVFTATNFLFKNRRKERKEKKRKKLSGFFIISSLES